MDIHDSALNLSKKIHRICERLEFIERLKYSSKIFTEKYQRSPTQYQLDRLITYLTLTCVDIAAGQEHKLFPNWLKEQLRKEQPIDNISQMIDSLMAIDIRADFYKQMGSAIKKYMTKTI